MLNPVSQLKRQYVVNCELLEDSDLFSDTFKVEVLEIQGTGLKIFKKGTATSSISIDGSSCLNADDLSLDAEIKTDNYFEAKNNCDYLKNFKSKSGKFETLTGKTETQKAKLMPSIYGHNHSIMGHIHDIDSTYTYENAEIKEMVHNANDNKIKKGQSMLGVFVGSGYNDLRIISIVGQVNNAV